MRGKRRTGISSEVRNSVSTIAVLLALPVIAGLFVMILYSSRYQGMIRRMDAAAELKPALETELAEDLFSVAAGRTSFEKSGVLETIHRIDNTLDTLTGQTEGNGHLQLTIARRTMDTMEQYTLKVRDGMTRDEISKATSLKDTVLTNVLRNLERCDFIIRYSQYGNKTKGAIYRLVDFYTLFYYRFVESHNGKDEQWWSHHFQSHSVESWQGMSFELICLTHLDQIKRRLGISGIAAEASSWRNTVSKGTDEKGAQIDLLIDRADRIINLCEMKFSVNPYVISKDYEQTLRLRMAIFKEKTNTRKSLVNTFVTTFGVANGIHHSIVDSEVLMEDLFEP